MSIRDEIKTRSIAALKAGDRETRSRLSGVVALFIEVEKAAGFSGWTEVREREVVASYAKKLKAALSDLGDRPLAAEYRAEIALLEPYLPQLLDAEATRELVAPLLEQARSLGQFMGLVMKSHKGAVDARLVREIAVEAGLS